MTASPHCSLTRNGTPHPHPLCTPSYGRCVESRGLTDAIKNLSSKELLRAVKKFAEYDPTHSGVISQVSHRPRYPLPHTHLLYADR